MQLFLNRPTPTLPFVIVRAPNSVFGKFNTQFQTIRIPQTKKFEVTATPPPQFIRTPSQLRFCEKNMRYRPGNYGSRGAERQRNPKLVK